MSVTHISAALRRKIRARAGDRCEYCLIPESLTFAVNEIDHLVAEKHGGRTHVDNLGLSCALCNAFKRSDLTSIDPESNQLAPLFHPRQHIWTDHFRVAEGRIDGIIRIPIESRAVSAPGSAGGLRTWIAYFNWNPDYPYGPRHGPVAEIQSSRSP